MPMTDWASSGGVKIERAKEQIRNPDAELQAFAERSPFEIVPETDDHAGLVHFRLQLVRQPWPTTH